MASTSLATPSAPVDRSVAGVSVLLPVYAKDDPSHLARALDSIAEQTVAPDEVVVVEDGPIGTGLVDALERAELRLPLRRVRLTRNLGMGCAMAVGLDACRYPWVARMDADDVCRPDRIERQLQYVAAHPEVDAVGSWITEFDQDEQAIYAERRVPLDHEGIRRYARSRNPMNHMDGDVPPRRRTGGRRVRPHHRGLTTSGRG